MILYIYRVFLFLIAFSVLSFNSCYSKESDSLKSLCEKNIIISDKGFCNQGSNPVFKIKGGSLLSPSILQRVASRCNNENLEISILLAKQNINEIYSCMGYVNSGSLIKKDSQGRFYLQIVEGTISKENIEISEVGLKAKSYVIDSIMDGDNIKILNVNDIRGRLELLKKSNVFKAINATVSPVPDKIGKAKIKISVKRAQPYNWALSLNNQQSESTGENQILYSGSKQGFFSLFDSVGANISISEGSQGLSIFYNNALSQKSNWNVSLERKESRIITEPLSSLDITSDYTKFSVGYNHQLYNSLITHNKKNDSEKSMWKSELELVDTNNYLLDRAFSFSAGEVEGKSSITSIQTSLTWEKKQRSDYYSYAFSASAGLDLGIEAVGSSKKTVNSAGSDYKIVKAALGYKRSMTENGYFSINMNGQYSNDLLLASKRIGLGGQGSVRGVDKNIISFDSSIAISTDSTILLPKLSGTPFEVSSTIDGNLYASVFADYAVGKENRSDEEYGLGSIGIGVNWHPTKHSKLNVSWAKPVTFKGFTDDQIDLLDDGRLDFNLTISGGE